MIRVPSAGRWWRQRRSCLVVTCFTRACIMCLQWWLCVNVWLWIVFHRFLALVFDRGWSRMPRVQHVASLLGKPLFRPHPRPTHHLKPTLAQPDLQVDVNADNRETSFILTVCTFMSCQVWKICFVFDHTVSVCCVHDVAWRRRFECLGSRYVSWLPSFSVEVRHSNLGFGLNSRRVITNSQFDNMVSWTIKTNEVTIAIILLCSYVAETTSKPSSCVCNLLSLAFNRSSPTLLSLQSLLLCPILSSTALL